MVAYLKLQNPSRRAATAALVLLVGCTSFSDSSSEIPEAEVESPTLKVTPRPPLDAPFSITTDPPEQHSCTEGTGCIQDYLSLPKRVRFDGPKRDADALERALMRIQNGKTKRRRDSLSPEALDAIVRRATGADPLLAEVPRHKRVVRILSEVQVEDTKRLNLLFEDPLVGSWEARLLLPLGEGPHPALVASHGHAEDAAHFLRRQRGSELPGLGYAVLAHNQRASLADADEDRVARALLAAGGSLMAVRAYEIAVGLAFLRQHPQVNSDRIALIGHAGGAVTNLLVIRLVSGFSAHITDGIGEFNSWDKGLLADESLPILFPVSNQLSDLKRQATPAIEFEFGYPLGMIPVDEFLRNSRDFPAP